MNNISEKQQRDKLDRYYHHGRRKYCLKVHIVLVTKYRKRLFFGSFNDDIKQCFYDSANAHGWNIVAMETDNDHIHLLLEYDTTECVSNIVKTLKQETTYHIWQARYAVLHKKYWKKRILWSDGYFACSIGEVSEQTIQRYIENQG